VRRPAIEAILVGPSALRREGLARILDKADFRIVASETNFCNLEATSLAEHKPLLLIIDSGIDTGAAAGQIELFKASHPSGRVAVISDHCRPADIISAFRVGANAYFVNVLTCDAFIKSLELVMLGETILPSELLSAIGSGKNAQEALARALGPRGAEPDVLPDQIEGALRLSEREKYILRCIIDGASNKLIARKINIAEATVKVHVKSILRKIRVQNRTQAAIWAVNNGLAVLAMVAGATPSLAPQSPLSQTQIASLTSNRREVELNHAALANNQAIAMGHRK
jgi:two-component system nitrate/nitrite response regulator NarL